MPSTADSMPSAVLSIWFFSKDFYRQPVQLPTCLTPASDSGREVPVSMNPFEDFRIVGWCILTLAPTEVDQFYTEDRLWFTLLI